METETGFTALDVGDTVIASGYSVPTVVGTVQQVDRAMGVLWVLGAGGNRRLVNEGDYAVRRQDGAPL